MWSREMLRDGENVLLVEPNQPDAVVNAIRRIAGDAALRRRMSMAGRATVCREADIRTFAASVAKICEAVVQRG